MFFFETITQIITFLVGNPELNLHLLASWVQGRSNGYASATRLSIASAESPRRFGLAFFSPPGKKTDPTTGMRNQRMKQKETPTPPGNSL